MKFPAGQNKYVTMQLWPLSLNWLCAWTHGWNYDMELKAFIFVMYHNVFFYIWYTKKFIVNDFLICVCIGQSEPVGVSANRPLLI